MASFLRVSISRRQYLSHLDELGLPQFLKTSSCEDHRDDLASRHDERCLEEDLVALGKRYPPRRG